MKGLMMKEDGMREYGKKKKKSIQLKFVIDAWKYLSKLKYHLGHMKKHTLKHKHTDVKY